MSKLKNKKLIWIVAAVVLILGIGIVVAISGKAGDKQGAKSEGAGDANGSNGVPQHTENSSNLSNSIEFDEDELETIVITEDMATDDKTITLDGSSVSYGGEGVAANGTDVVIEKAGEYIVKGTLDDGRIVVDTDSDSDVTLIFAGVNISNDNSCCVYVKSADKVIINLADGTENILNDGEKYVYDDETEEEPNATIFSKDDLVIAGTGKLTVNGNFNNGIASKDDLKITGGDISVTASNNGIKGKDSLVIANAVITVDAVGDALKSDNETEEGRGYIYIESGTFNITSGEDGMQAATDIEITDGTFTINTGEGSKVTSSGNDDWGMPGWGNMGGMNNSSTTDTASIKAIKAAGNISINGGSFNIDSEDDCVHANVDLVINGGTFELTSGDDGLHADTNLTVNDGDIKISKSYEGIEATNIYICGGTIDVTASDDGLNAAGGNDASSMGRPGMGGFSGSSGSITFTGGTLTIDASGDGVDSNGTVVFDGGKVIVYGPTNNGNGTLDYQTSWTQNGGSFIGIGSSGMAQMPGNDSSQNSVMITFTSNYGDGDVVVIKDSSGNVVMEIEGHKAFNNVVFSNPDLKMGEKYTIYVNDDKYDEFTIDSVCTTIGSAGGMGGPGGMGGQGGFGGPDGGQGGDFGGGRPGWR